MAVVAGGGVGQEGSLLDWIQSEFDGQIGNVHRLDPEASGVVLFARSKAALDFLSGQFQSKSAVSVYFALVAGTPTEDAFSIEKPLGDDKSRRGRLQITLRGGRPAVTQCRVLERFKGFAWLECRPQPERMHQIRVHLASVGLPVLNDSLYGGEARLLLSSLKRGYKGRDEERPLIDSLALHASQLTVTHPVTREAIILQSPLTKDLDVALKYLRRYGGGTRRAPVAETH
jgi:RluA family pseudouridine synthase